MTAPLWDFPAVPAGKGPVRGQLAGALDAARAAGQDPPEDLALVALALADRIDEAIARRERRGFTLLTAEYRAARAQLFDGLPAGGDGFDAAFATFLEAEARNGQ